MISEKTVTYEELRASEEALLPNGQLDVPLPLAPCSLSRRIIKGISRRLDCAHSKTTYRLAILQALLIAVYTVVFIILQSRTLEFTNGALMPCECLERGRPPLRNAHKTAF